MEDRGFTWFWLTSWLISTTSAVLFLVLAQSIPMFGRFFLAELIFLIPVYILVIISICRVIYNHAMLLIIVCGPPCIAAGLVLRFSSSKWRDEIASLIFLSPLLCITMVMCIFFLWGFVTYCLLFVVDAFHTLQALFYASLGWRYVFGLPRYRVPDPFSQSELCGNCTEMLRESRLLFGSWHLFTKADEQIDFIPTKRPQPSNAWPTCQLCRRLTKEFQRTIENGTAHTTSNYGTISSMSNPPVSLGDGTLSICIREKAWYGPWIPSEYSLQLLGPGGLKSVEFNIKEGNDKGVKPLTTFIRANSSIRRSSVP